MFYSKKIKALNERVAELEKQMARLLQPIVPKRGEDVIEHAKRVERRIQDLVDYDCMINLDAEHFEFAISHRSEDEQRFLRQCRDGYEKRLRRFIRNTNSQSKKPKKNGKETPKAAE